jgi:hypothetical protein
MAGVSIIDISPEKGVGLAGYPHCPRPNEGVHDPLYASCLYLNDDKQDVVLVTLDLLYFGKKYVRRLRERFGKNIMFTCSHTHCGPCASHIPNSVANTEDECQLDESYVEGLINKLEQVIGEAIANPFDAELGTYVGYCGAEQGVGGNRRTEGGLADPTVNVLAVKDKNGDVRACLVNYTLHPTYLHAENLLATADYPGYIRRYFSFAQPKAVIMFAQGTSGDQSSRYHRVGQDFEEAARAGTTLGVEANHCIEKMSFSGDISIRVESREIELPLRVYPSVETAEENVRAAKAKFEALRAGDYIPMRNAELALFGAENTLNFAKLMGAGFVSEELPCEVQIITIGDTAIVGVQGEVFVEYGLAIKELSPHDKTFVFTVTNGALPGYVYTPEAAKIGGYEIGTSMLSENAGSDIVKTVKEMF